MTISPLTIKLFGAKQTVFRVMQAGEVVHVAESREAAELWMSAQ